MDREYLDAIHLTTTRDFSGAIRQYEQILTEVSVSAKPYALVDLGRAYESGGRPDDAVKCYQQASQGAPQYPTPFLRLGVMYARMQDAQNAGKAFQQAESLYQASTDLEGVAETYYQRGVFANSQRDLRTAQTSLQKAFEIARTTGNPHQQIRTLLQLSIVAFERGNTQSGQQSAKEALGLARSNGIEHLTVRGLIDLGSAVFVQGDYATAEGYFKDALHLAQLYHTRRLEARALFMIGSLRIQQDNPDEGIRAVQEALAYYEQNGFRKEAASAWLLIGRGRRDQGDFDSAVRAFQQQLTLAEAIADRSLAADAHEGIGGVLLRQEKYPDALEHFRENYAINKSIESTLNLTYAALQLGDVSWRLGRYREADEMYREASTLAATSAELQGEINAGRAEMLLSQLRFAEAKTKCRLALAGTPNLPRALAEVRRIRGLAEVFSGERRQGLQNCQSSGAIASQLHDPWLMSQSRLALAQAMLQTGDAQRALAIVAEERANFERWGQVESRLSSLVISTRAQQSLGDPTVARQFATQARDLLFELKRKWGAAIYKQYITRPDIHMARAQLAQIITLED
jgi:tetratricopeptide (TPR) repeat protein